MNPSYYDILIDVAIKESIVVIPLQTILYVVLFEIFFMFNIQKPKKIISYGTFVVESPKLFSAKKTAMYGMFALLSIFMINVPAMLENTSAYATGIDTTLDTSEHSLVRIHFDTGSPVHPNLVLAHDQVEFTLLEERTNMRNHFQYGQFESNSSEELANGLVVNHGRV